MEVFYSAVIIMILRICDVTLGTLRTLFVIQSRKYHAGITGFFEVLVWIFAMKYIVEHMDNIFNLIGYATGFGLGAILGLTLEQKIGIGFAQVNIMSNLSTDAIVDALRNNQFGVTVMSATGISGGVNIINTVINKRKMKELRAIVDEIDPNGFINIQPALPLRGFIHGARK
ncbi:MAG: DUF2179 domain-containing protein [Bacteroidetes bacterium]|nr:DUF2179 domain-containing protein [Bacteroidota bacterium]